MSLLFTVWDAGKVWQFPLLPCKPIKINYSERKVTLFWAKKQIRGKIIRTFAIRTDCVAPIAGIMAFHCQRLFQSAGLGYFFNSS